MKCFRETIFEDATIGSQSKDLTRNGKRLGTDVQVRQGRIPSQENYLLNVKKKSSHFDFWSNCFFFCVVQNGYLNSHSDFS